MASIRLPIIGKTAAVYVPIPKKTRYRGKHRVNIFGGRGYTGKHRKNPSIFKPFGGS